MTLKIARVSSDCFVYACILSHDHHGPHKQADGRYFGSTHHGICEGCMLDAIAMLEHVEGERP